MSSETCVEGGGSLRGVVRVPGDKSISHRALLFNALAHGRATISGLLESEDVHATADCLRALGVSIENGQVVGAAGQFGEPSGELNCGNSGTTIRLLLGALSGQPLRAVLTGDASLCGRPMGRVTHPLSMMGATFKGDADKPPIEILGGQIKNIGYTSPVASAQVKTALMLAAIQGEGLLEFEEPSCSRDHTERMFEAMGIRFERNVSSTGIHRLKLKGPQRLRATSMEVPGDISSAAFFLVAASILPGSDILIENVGMNPTRTGIIDVLLRMGADIVVRNERLVSGEPVADLQARSSELNGTTIQGAEVPRLVDELPIIAVAASEARGQTRVRDAAELRVKESDRIDATVAILESRGITVTSYGDGFDIQGRTSNHSAGIEVHAQGDHRIAMAGIIAALCCRGKSTIRGTEAIDTSFPGFLAALGELRA